MGQCRICRSTSSKIVSNLLKEGLSYRLIAQKIKGTFLSVTLHSLEQSVGRHDKNNHVSRQVPKDLTALKQVFDLTSTRQISWNEFKEMVRSVGYENLLKNPESIGPREVIALESVENQKKRDRYIESAMDQAMTAFFSGHFKPHICPNCHEVTIPKVEDYTDERNSDLYFYLLSIRNKQVSTKEE
ncbi:hypothetical protein HY029_02860 [Candidatus Gottesmanbacteria bacterium]|nr:hypothetical protein [Candidatus Gottesmanbacteria bacterium]